jgi:hypothetical protein
VLQAPHNAFEGAAHAFAGVRDPLPAPIRILRKDRRALPGPAEALGVVLPIVRAVAKAVGIPGGAFDGFADALRAPAKALGVARDALLTRRDDCGTLNPRFRNDNQAIAASKRRPNPPAGTP